MPTAQGQVQQTIAELVRAAASRYGIRDVDGFIQAMIALAGAESSWNPMAIGDNGASGGLFQLHERGQGAGMSMEARQDPSTNIEKAITYLAPVFAASEAAGFGWEEGLRRMTGPDGQNPADPEQLYQNALALARQMGGVAGGIAGEMGRQGMGGLGQVGQGGAGVPENDLSSFIVSHFGLQDEEGYTATQQAMDIIMDDPWKATALFQSLTAGEGGDLERRSAEAGVAIDEANARRIIAELGGDTYEQGRQRILDQIDEKHWDKKQAISEFNAWMSAALEAGKRAETVYGEEMKRKVWTTPTEHYPGTEKGGINEQMYERYGLEYKPSPGIAVETLPNLEDMYGRWHGKMGISQQAPPTAGGWSGQGQGQEAGLGARDFLQRMKLRQGVR